MGEYVREHTERGACQCGRCIDAPDEPKNYQPAGHTADLHFFKVSAVKTPDADTLLRLTKAHDGVFRALDPLNGDEHGFIALGAWLGDQGLALRYMGLGVILDVFELRTPKTIGMPEGLHDTLARRGLVGVVRKGRTEAETANAAEGG